MMENTPTNYKKLMTKVKDAFVFNSAQAVLHWDMETMMPPKAIGLRSQQLALLSGMQHRMETDPEIGKLLENIESDAHYDKLDALQKRNIYLIRKNYDEQTKLPEKLVVEIAKQRAIAVDTWKKAKAAKNFSMFKPELEKNIELAKKAAEILKEVKKTTTPYDALIDIFEPKMTAKEITRVFDELREGLVSLLRKCEASS